MSNTSMKLKNVERKIKDFNSSLTQFEEQFVIIPFQPSGYIDYSNFGQVTNQVQIDQFETYKRLYTGNDAFIVTWKGAIDFDYSNQSPNSDTTTKIDLKYGVGEVLLGWLEDSTTENDITTDTSFSEYKSQKSKTNYVFRINAARFQLNENYTYYFYKVPEISNQILFRVVSLEKEYLGKDLMCYVLRLESLQDTLANTGRAKQQNVMPNAVGQGYIQPQVEDSTEYTLPEGAVEGTDYVSVEGNRYVIANKTYLMNNPTKYVVIKLYGLAILCNVSFVGRRAYLSGNFKDYGSPRLIFPMNFSTPSTETIYRTQQQEVNFYWLVNGAPIINFTNEMFDALKSFLAFSKFWSQEGVLTLDKDQTQGTNPKQNNGNSYLYQLYGQQTANGYLPWIFSFSKKTINTSYTYGCASTYTIGGNKKIHDHMFDCYWIQKQITVLPLNKDNTLNFGWTLGATYAAAVARNITTTYALFLIGILGTLYEKITAPVYQGIYGLIPASLCDFMLSESQITLQNDGYIRFDYFLNPDSEDLGEFASFFKTANMNTSFQAELTDIIQDNNGNEYITEEIAQTVDSEGNNIKPDGTALLMDGNYTLKENTEENLGYIIDSFNIQAIFKGDFSVEFLDLNQQVIWTGVYQSNAKWTGTIREINTWKDTSIFGRENQYLGKPLAWPKALQPLDPQGQDFNLSFSPNNIIYQINWGLNSNVTSHLTLGTWGYNRTEPVSGILRNGFDTLQTTKYQSATQPLLVFLSNSKNDSAPVDLGIVFIAAQYSNIQTFLNFYNKFKATVAWDISLNTTLGGYATDTDNWNKINLDNITWVADSDTTTEWVDINTPQQNGQDFTQYAVARKLFPTTQNGYKPEGSPYDSGVVSDLNGYFIPGVYGYAGPSYVTENGTSYNVAGGLVGSPTIKPSQEYQYGVKFKFQARLEIQSNSIVLHCRVILYKFNMWLNLDDFALSMSPLQQGDLRGWIAGVYYTTTGNLPANHYYYFNSQLSFQIKLVNFQLIRDF